jgi:hypothetical protein
MVSVCGLAVGSTLLFVLLYGKSVSGRRIDFVILVSTEKNNPGMSKYMSFELLNWKRFCPDLT